MRSYENIDFLKMEIKITFLHVKSINMSNYFFIIS